MKTPLLLAGLLAVVAINPVIRSWSQPLPPPNSKAKPASPRRMHADGDLLTRKETPAGTVFTYQGHVKFTSEDTTLLTELVSFNNQTKIANAPGKVNISDSRNTIAGDSGLAYYNSRDARILGSVVITVRPKPGDQNAPEGSTRRDFKDPATIFCDRVDYNWRTKIAVVPGHLTIKQKDRTVTADKGRYDTATETVTLTGHVKGVDSKGRQGEGKEAVIILREGEEAFTISGPVSTSFDLDEDESAPPPAAVPKSPTNSPVRGTGKPVPGGSKNGGAVPQVPPPGTLPPLGGTPPPPAPETTKP